MRHPDKFWTKAAVGVLGLTGFFLTAQAAPTILWTRLETNSLTPQMVESFPGFSSTYLPFAGTTNYEFFSTFITAPVMLTTADKGGGNFCMRNTSPVGGNDFAVTGRMRYFDYNPATGVETLIVDTGTSGQKNVNHGQTVNWALPNVSLAAAKTLSAGHLLHVSLTVNLTAGYPGGFGSLVVNSFTGTQAIIPENRGMGWPFGPLRPASRPTISVYSTDAGACTIGFSGVAGASYTIQAATNLGNPAWTSLATTNAGTNGWVVFKDVDASKYPCRFYRSAQ